tara:strand:- start:467 stop:631 length:165 start_codon:yes stop_codon:yes gene_type:complete
MSISTLPRTLGAIALSLYLGGMLSGCGVLIAGAAGGAAGYVAGTAAGDDDDKKD